MQLERSHEESAVGNQVDKTGEMNEKPLPREAGAEEKRGQLLKNCKEGRDATKERAR